MSPADVLRKLLAEVDAGKCYLLDADIIEPLHEIIPLAAGHAVRRVAPFELRVRYKYDNQ